LEEVERVGYGITPPQQYSDPEVVEIPELVKNEEYRNKLSESAQREYDMALLGMPYEYREGTYDPEAQANSCYGRAMVDLPTLSESDVELAWLKIKEPLDAAREAMRVGYTFDEQNEAVTILGPYAVERDPKFVKLEAEYAECVQAKAEGWNASGVVGIGLPHNIAVNTASDGSQLEPPPEGKSVDITNEPPEYSNLVGSQIEKDIAVVDFKCRQETDYVARHAELVYDAQARYVKDHQAALNQMLIELEQLVESNR
jgi:hypothetical protein